MTTKANKPVVNKTVNEGAQTKISDSQSWIMYLRHFTRENSLDYTNIKHTDNQLQYVIASTFDCWLSIKAIDVKSLKWIKLYQMKMSLPVVNSFIEFNDKFQPKSLVLAYFDGSIDYSPWEKIERNFAIEILAGRRRGVVKGIVEIMRETNRGGYVNKIIDQSQSLEEALMLETICFLHKKGELVYAINFKGQVKIFSIKDQVSGLNLLTKIYLPNRVIKAQFITHNSVIGKDSITVIVCYLDIPIPIMLQLSPKVNQSQLQQKTEYIYQKHLANADLQYQNKVAIKLITYDPCTKLIITCNQDNKIEFYSLQQQQYSHQSTVFMSSIQRCFSIIYKDTTQIINDISVKESKLAIICQRSFSIYDLVEEVMLIEGEKIKQEIDIGKLVVMAVKGRQKPLLLVKKKFNYFVPLTKKSTTLHLFLTK